MDEKVKEISWKDFSMLKYLASYCVFGNQSFAVGKDKDSYFIRVIKSLGYSKREWEYFSLDSSGLITESPRGMAKQFNKKIRIIDMEDMVNEYKGKIINQ